MKLHETLPSDEHTTNLLTLLVGHIGALDYEKLFLSTSINHDLGCDGDDAAELMAELGELFTIKFEDYDAYRYFKPEGYDLLKWLRKADRHGNIPLTFAMLRHAIVQGRWVTKEIEAHRRE